MRSAFCLLLAFLLLAQGSLCYGLEWKKMHERADRISLEQAFGSANKSPGSLDDIYILGLVYLNLHRDKEAGEEFSRMEALKPGTIGALWGRAEVARRGHDIKKAEELLSEVVKADPDFPPALITLAYIKYVQMDFKGSVNLAYKVISQGSGKVDLSNLTRGYLLAGGGRGMLAHYGGILSKVANGTSVLRNLKKAEELQPGSAAVYFGLGSFYLLAPSLAGGDRKKAKEYLQRAVKADPLLADAYVRLAQYYSWAGDRGKYEACMKRASEIDPRNELLLDARSGECKFLCGGAD